MYNYVELSKEVSYALRHAPWEYELEMDEGGWVSAGQLLEALHRDKRWEGICEADLQAMLDSAEKNVMRSGTEESGRFTAIPFP